MAGEDRPVGGQKPRSNVYSILLLITTAAYITGIVLLIMQMQDVRNFNHQLFGEMTFRTSEHAAKIEAK
jgi:hypothetical protein